jgi:hypothetical protein
MIYSIGKIPCALLQPGVYSNSRLARSPARWYNERRTLVEYIKMRVKLTAEYVCGLIAGTGVGLGLVPVLVRWTGIGSTELALIGLMLACAGGIAAYIVQERRRFASDPATH